MSESKTCMMLSSLVNCNFLNGTEIIELDPGLIYSVYTVYWNSQSALVKFYARSNRQHYIRIEVNNERYEKAIGDCNMVKFIKDQETAYALVFEFITDTPGLSKYFKLRT
jgi:hypothetical protein